MRPILDEFCALLGVAPFMKTGTLYFAKSRAQTIILNLSNSLEKLISEFQHC